MTLSQKDRFLADLGCQDMLSLDCFQGEENFDINGILNPLLTQESEEEEPWVFTSVDS